MGKIIAFILILAIGFGAGWIGRSYKNASDCRAAGGVLDTNRGICAGAASTTVLAA
jgi:hypothetical protein